MRALLDGQHFVFLCFLPGRAASLGKVVAAAKGPGPVGLVHFSVPPGALWNGEACEVFAVPKSAVGRAALDRGLREHLGYEMPAAESDLFTLGVTPEDDAELGRVGLFGEARRQGD
jgi:hypothetical protein